MVVIFLAYYSLATPPVSKNPAFDSKRLKNETESEHRERLAELGIYTLPGGKCYHTSSPEEEWCIPKMDSCCYGMFKGICIGSKDHWGRAVFKTLASIESGTLSKSEAKKSGKRGYENQATGNAPKSFCSRMSNEEILEVNSEQAMNIDQNHDGINQQNPANCQTLNTLQYIQKIMTSISDKKVLQADDQCGLEQAVALTTTLVNHFASSSNLEVTNVSTWEKRFERLEALVAAKLNTPSYSDITRGSSSTHTANPVPRQPPTQAVPTLTIKLDIADGVQLIPQGLKEALIDTIPPKDGDGGVSPKEYLESQIKEKMSKLCKISQPFYKMPTVRMEGLGNFDSGEELKQLLDRKFPQHKDKIKVILLHKTYSGNQQAAIVRVPKEIYAGLINSGELYFKYSRLKIKKHTHVTMCYKCQMYGHISTNCENKPVILTSIEGQIKSPYPGKKTVDEVKKLKSGLNQLKLELPSKRMRIRNEVKKSLLDLSEGANDNFKTLSDDFKKLGQKWREMRAKAEKHEQSILVLIGQSHELAEKSTVKKLEASLQSLTEKVGVDSDGTQLLIKAHLDRIEKLEQSSSQQSRDDGRLDYLEELMLQSIQDSGRIFHLEQKLEQSSAQSARDQLRFQQLEQQSARDRILMNQLAQQIKNLLSAHTEPSNILVKAVEEPNSSSAVGNVEQFELSVRVDMHTPPPVA
ncbi:hypothetical protein HDE_04953 [Halotydeus destructor]|nr:hypothetical protein HDE_04953 [Halotydeus destructor]